MKKTLFFLTAVMFLFSACTKDQRINRKLDGSWDVTMYEDVVISPQTQYIYNFEKERNGKGSGSYSITYPGFSISKEFTYEIENEIMKYMVKDSSGQTVTTLWQIAGYNKDKFVFVNASNNKTTNLRAR